MKIPSMFSSQRVSFKAKLNERGINHIKNVEKKTDATFIYRIRSRFGFNIFFPSWHNI